MDRNELYRKYARTDEDKMLISRVCDLADAAQRHWKCVFSEFMTPAEQALIAKVTELNREVETEFFGGYDGAERRILAVYPDEFSKPDFEDVPIDAVTIDVRFAEISHRDILGSLMGLQIQRNRIGDILDTCSPPVFLCHRSMTEFILQNLAKIGRNGVRLSRGQVTETPEQKYDEIRASVASMRLDALTAECFGISRTKAAEFIKSGAVQLNWETIEDTAREVAPGDKLSLRGYGKAKIHDLGGVSKKGRQFVVIRRLK